jgi:hypothetical protein
MQKVRKALSERIAQLERDIRKEEYRAQWLANPFDLHYRGELLELGVRVVDAQEQSEIAMWNYRMEHAYDV